MKLAKTNLFSFTSFLQKFYSPIRDLRHNLDYIFLLSNFPTFLYFWRKNVKTFMSIKKV